LELGWLDTEVLGCELEFFSGLLGEADPDLGVVDDFFGELGLVLGEDDERAAAVAASLSKCVHFYLT